MDTGLSDEAPIRPPARSNRSLLLPRGCRRTSIYHSREPSGSSKGSIGCSPCGNNGRSPPFSGDPSPFAEGLVFAAIPVPPRVEGSSAEIEAFRFRRQSIARSKPESGDRSPLESLRSEFARKPFQQCFVVVHSSSAATHLICERRLSIAQSQGMCAAANGNLACVWASLCVYIDQ